MGELLLAGAMFLGAHLGVSSTPLRGVLIRTIGERAYLGVYSLMAVVTLVYLIAVYNHSSHVEFLWLPTPALQGIAFLIMPFAFIFLLGAFLTPNPTAIGQESAMKVAGAGLIRITRHPLQWAIVFWAIAHIIANGDLASLLFFGTLGTLSLAGAFLIDVKKARSMGEDWTSFASTTSNVPFVAIFQSRNRLVWREIMLPIVAGFGIYALVLWGHVWVSGVALIG